LNSDLKVRSLAPSYKTWCGMQESNLLRLA
jgi:hypothetical protein